MDVIKFLGKYTRLTCMCLHHVLRSFFYSVERRVESDESFLKETKQISSLELNRNILPSTKNESGAENTPRVELHHKR